MILDDLLFIETGDGVDVPALWEDGRLDFITRRRFEGEAHYDHLIGEYERHLDEIRADLARSPGDHNLHQLEYLYRQRAAEARRKKDTILDDLRDEERRHRQREEQREREERQRSGPSFRNQMMYGFAGA